MASLSARRITSGIGVEIAGVDMRAAQSADAVAFVRAAVMEHGVAFLRGQHLTPAQFWAFCAHFGVPLKDETTGTGQDTAEMLHTSDMSPARHATAVWHADTTSLATPPWATVLRAVSPPAFGGDTCWSSMYAAWDALSERMQRMLDGLTAVHSIQPTYQRMLHYAPFFQAQYDPLHAREQVHPVVLTHPETGRKALYVSESFVTRIVELAPLESRAVLDFLFRHVERPDFGLRWHWQANDVAFWDNRCVQHYAVPDYDSARVMQRICLLGNRPGEPGLPPMPAGEGVAA